MKGSVLFVVQAIGLWSHFSSDVSRNLLNVSVLLCCNLGLNIYHTMANGGDIVCLFLGIVLGIVLAIC